MVVLLFNTAGLLFKKETRQQKKVSKCKLKSEGDYIRKKAHWLVFALGNMLTQEGEKQS